MGVQAKGKDYGLSLLALARGVGDDPGQVTWGLRRRLAVRKASHAHVRKWERRFQLTMARFPFVLHTACDECLECPTSATATLNGIYEGLAKEVSEELHFLVRWAAHVMSKGGRT